MSEFVIGLRGGIGTGKSSVSDLFAGNGIVVADADVSARTVVEPGQPAYQAIVEHFGKDILLPDGYLNRPKLREIVFADKESRRFLERQTVGLIVQDLAEQIAAATSAYAILVLSTGLGKTPQMNRLLVVDAPVEQQIERVMARDNNSKAQVEAILEAQPPRQARLRDADDVILNDGDVHHLTVEVEKLHALYLSLAN
ncbi:MAG: dephospho-CoA kinase [Gammaproteobacteria bacterium]|jgi:dephospho-CoA kinase|nr:dephospho-CoA kinase [Gammaproteobacteria bacterium]MBT4494935.1 dephospho-CoA kinase [Gammaproteobacteria bacterium]